MAINENVLKWENVKWLEIEATTNGPLSGSGVNGGSAHVVHCLAPVIALLGQRRTPCHHFSLNDLNCRAITTLIIAVITQRIVM